MLPNLSAQLEKIMTAYRHERTGEPMSSETKKKWAGNLRLFALAITEHDPSRKIEGLADFQPQDFEAYKTLMEGHKGGALTGVNIATRLMALKGVFKAAYGQRVIPTNIVEGFKPPKVISEEQYRRLQPDEIERLCAIDEKKLAQLDVRRRFFYLRGIAMAAIQKDAALRASEVIRLCEEDVLWDRRSAGGHVPLIIRESKGRVRGHQDMTYLLRATTQIPPIVTD